jgi:hypothetical protein
MVVNANQRRLWYLAIGSLRTILIEHVEPDEFGARSWFLAHVSIFLPMLVPWQAAQKLSNLRFHFDRSSTAVICRKNSFGATCHEPGLFIGNNEGFGIGEIG